jgi:hypothetical protein
MRNKVKKNIQETQDIFMPRALAMCEHLVTT